MTHNREWTHSTNKVPSHSLPWFSALYYSGLADRWRKLPRRGVEARQNEIGKLNATVRSAPAPLCTDAHLGFDCSIVCIH